MMPRRDLSQGRNIDPAAVGGKLLAKADEEVQPLRLDGDVERGHGIVANEETGLHRQRRAMPMRLR